MPTSNKQLMLAIDTATAVTGVALYDGQPIAELNWRSSQNQSVELLPAVLGLLDRQGWTFREIHAVAVSLGPGGFNGLRVGLSTAKALAYGRNLPCLGVGTLEATAYQHLIAERVIRPVYDAGKNEVATALFCGERGQLRVIEEPHLTTLDALFSVIDRPTLVCGELHPEWIDLLTQQRGDLVAIPSPAARVRRTGYLAELAWQRWQSGEGDDVAALQPVYLRQPTITPSSGRMGATPRGG